jgi:hypothetical protein
MADSAWESAYAVQNLAAACQANPIWLRAGVSGDVATAFEANAAALRCERRFVPLPDPGPAVLLPGRGAVGQPFRTQEIGEITHWPRTRR